ncbi:MAG TPA: helix-turn-helix domain-containing protein, partial [Pseudohaliea sp.]|nr:helix-turn-helix domain-containing protein [Pseudohaliea sp.]
MAETERRRRRQAVGDVKRGLILEAARRVFARDGLEGASLRAIAAEAGYTPAALYFHFDSKEAIYGDLLAQSLAALKQTVDAAAAAVPAADGPEDRLRAVARAFFRFYAESPQDLDLGFYLMRGGVGPKGVGRARDRDLNAR